MLNLIHIDDDNLYQAKRSLMLSAFSLAVITFMDLRIVGLGPMFEIGVQVQETDILRLSLSVIVVWLLIRVMSICVWYVPIAKAEIISSQPDIAESLKEITSNLNERIDFIRDNRNRLPERIPDIQSDIAQIDNAMNNAMAYTRSTEKHLRDAIEDQIEERRRILGEKSGHVPKLSKDMDETVEAMVQPGTRLADAMAHATSVYDQSAAQIGALIELLRSIATVTGDYARAADDFTEGEFDRQLLSIIRRTVSDYEAAYSRKTRDMIIFGVLVPLAVGCGSLYYAWFG